MLTLQVLGTALFIAAFLIIAMSEDKISIDDKLLFSGYLFFTADAIFTLTNSKIGAIYALQPYVFMCFALLTIMKYEGKLTSTVLTTAFIATGIAAAGNVNTGHEDIDYITLGIFLGILFGYIMISFTVKKFLGFMLMSTGSIVMSYILYQNGIYMFALVNVFGAISTMKAAIELRKLEREVCYGV